MVWSVGFAFFFAAEEEAEEEEEDVDAEDSSAEEEEMDEEDDDDADDDDDDDDNDDDKERFSDPVVIAAAVEDDADAFFGGDIPILQWRCDIREGWNGAACKIFLKDVRSAKNMKMKMIIMNMIIIDFDRDWKDGRPIQLIELHVELSDSQNR